MEIGSFGVENHFRSRDHSRRCTDGFRNWNIEIKTVSIFSVGKIVYRFVY